MDQSFVAAKLNASARLLMRHGIWIALSLTLVTLWGLLTLSAVIQQRRLMEANTRELTQLNRVVAQHSHALFNTIETDLRTLDLALHWQPRVDPLSDPRFIGLVEQYRRASGGLIDVRAISQDGMLYRLPSPDHQPGASVKDREVYQTVTEQGGSPFHIGVPVAGRLNGKWGIPVSWRLSSPVGDIVALEVFVELDRLVALHDRFRVKPEGSIAILRLDGYMLSRTPFDTRLVGSNFKANPQFASEIANKLEGTFIASGSATDGIERIVSYERLDDYPLIVIVARGVHEAMATFYSRLIGVTVVAGALSLVLIAFAIAFRRSLRSLFAARNELKQTLMEQEAIFNNAATGIAFVKDRVIHRCNHGFESLFGYREGELIGKSPSVLYPSQEEFEERRDKLYENLTRTGTHGGDKQYLHKDGHLIWCTTYVKLIDKLDLAQGMIFVTQDITKRKAAEAALEQANQQLAHLSTTDGLTGLPNRRSFDEIVKREWRRALRNKESLALAMIDVDNFKAYNDRYGHLAGDQCLRTVAQTLAAGLRDGSDFIARYGGEEFVIILPGQHLQNASDVFERLRRSVEALGLPHLGNTGVSVVTFSAGYIVTVPSNASSLDEVLTLADQNLYQAKRNGRNRIYGP